MSLIWPGAGMHACRVINTILASLTLPDASRKVLSTQLELHVLARAAQQPARFSYPPKEKRIRWLGALPRGKVFVRIPEAGEDVLTAGQPVPFEIQVGWGAARQEDVWCVRRQACAFFHRGGRHACRCMLDCLRQATHRTACCTPSSPRRPYVRRGGAAA